MLAIDVMTTKPEYLAPEDSLKDAALHMKSHDYGFVPIGKDDRLIGAVTDRDITVRGVAEGKSPTAHLDEVMTEGIQYCYENDDIEEVAKKMKSLQIRRLVVLNQDKRMTGVISLGDIAMKVKDNDLLAEVTEEVSKH